jgi:hypothetical protein
MYEPISWAITFVLVSIGVALVIAAARSNAAS